MKKIQIFTLAALMLGFASCSKELNSGGGDQDAPGGFQLTVQASKGVLTYADIATAPEWDFGSVDVYIFKRNATGDGLLLGTTADFVPTSISGVATKDGTVTLTSKATWLTEIEPALATDRYVNAYFVGNNEAANLFGGAAQVAPTKLVTTEKEFIESLTIEQLDGGSGFAQQLESPLLFSASHMALPVPEVGVINTTITLKRREARFDIVNINQDDLKVLEVHVTNANTQGFVFGNATGQIAGVDIPIPSSSLEIVNVAGAPYTVDDPLGLQSLMPSVFYLYPTQLGEGDTEIHIAATLNGVPKLFEVQSNARIEANKRYKLVFDIVSMVFKVVVADYDEGIEMPAVTASGKGLTDLVSSTGTGTTNNSYKLAAGVSGQTLTATLGAVSADGFDVTVSPSTTIVDESVLNATQSVGPLTYGSAFYPTTVDIAIDYPASVGNTEVFVTFTDKGNPKNTATILLYDAVTRTPEAAANSYMVKNGDAAIAIPFDNMIAHWGAFASTDVFNAELVWTDNSNGMNIEGSVAGAYIQGTGDAAVLLVTPGKKEGNAVIAVSDASGDIKWSFHIWNTNYDPATDNYLYEATGTATATAPGNGKKHRFMDRNLGAFSATPGDINSGGLLYQWGRKDPFWGAGAWANTERSMFDATGGAVNVIKQDVQTHEDVPTAGTGANNLNYSIENPLVFLWNSVDHNPGTRRDWYTIEGKAAQKNDLWATVGAAAPFNVTESIYDPCPAGYRVHENGAYAGLARTENTYAFPWSAANRGRFGTYAPSASDWSDPGIAPGADNTVGYYPASGARSGASGSFTSVGTAGYYWSSTAGTSGVSYYLNFTATALGTSSSSTRANGFPVRCCRQE